MKFFLKIRLLWCDAQKLVLTASYILGIVQRILHTLSHLMVFLFLFLFFKENWDMRIKPCSPGHTFSEIRLEDIIQESLTSEIWTFPSKNLPKSYQVYLTYPFNKSYQKTSSHHKALEIDSKNTWGVPIVTQQKQIWLVSMSLEVWPLALFHWVRDPVLPWAVM